MPEWLIDPWCLTLPREFAEATDFKAEEAVKIDKSVKLPSNYSLGEWVYKTNYQGSIGSCTANSTTHGLQVLNVKKNWIKPVKDNIITPNWKDLWTKMWHNPEKYEGWDYVENAVRTALKEWIQTLEWWIAKYDGYAHWEWKSDLNSIDDIKRYIYAGCPVIWVIQGNSDLWLQMTKWEVKGITGTVTWGHAICCVWFDDWGLWFLNSWSPNDKEKRKSRFYISNQALIDLGWRMNYRYWVLYTEKQEKKDAEYLKRKNWALVVLQYFKKVYDNEPIQVKEWIVALSKALRECYPELNDDLPL